MTLKYRRFNKRDLSKGHWIQKLFISLNLSARGLSNDIKNHQNRTSETYLKIIQFCLKALGKVKCQGSTLQPSPIYRKFVCRIENQVDS